MKSTKILLPVLLGIAIVSVIGMFTFGGENFLGKLFMTSPKIVQVKQIEVSKEFTSLLECVPLFTERKKVSDIKFISEFDTSNIKLRSPKKINVVFVGHFFDDIASFVDVAQRVVDKNQEGYDVSYATWFTNDLQRIYGFLSTEPYKSNSDVFDFWYVNSIYSNSQNSNFCDGSLTNLESVCPSENRYVINLCNYNTQTAGISSVYENGFKVVDENGDLDLSTIGLINHEFGGHAIGFLGDVAYPGLYGTYSDPNCMDTITNAQNKWSNLIGDGCGQDDVVDCSEDCYEQGTCGPDEYYTEVQYVAVQPEDCFDQNNNYIQDCSLDIKRSSVGDGGFIYSKPITMKAMTEIECQNSSDHCMYLNQQGIYCYDKSLNRLDFCSNLSDSTVYPDFPRHNQSTGCVYKPHLSSIMKGSNGLKFGPVNEREICDRLNSILGSIGGVCSTEYGF